MKKTYILYSRKFRTPNTKRRMTSVQAKKANEVRRDDRMIGRWVEESKVMAFYF